MPGRTLNLGSLQKAIARLDAWYHDRGIMGMVRAWGAWGRAAGSTIGGRGGRWKDKNASRNALCAVRADTTHTRTHYGHSPARFLACAL
mgnify:CR=1 FL=1